MAWDKEPLSPQDFEDFPRMEKLKEMQKEAMRRLLGHPELGDEMANLIEKEFSIIYGIKFAKNEEEKKRLEEDLKKVRERIWEVEDTILDRWTRELVKKEEEKLYKEIWRMGGGI